MSKKLDDTRKRLDIDALESNRRKDLFDKFVDKGGKVVAEKDDIFSTKSTSKQTQGKVSSVETTRERMPNRENETLKKISNSIKEKNKKVSFSIRFHLWFNAYSNGVINFTGKSINVAFIKYIQLSVIPAFLEIDISIFNMLNPISNYTEETVAKRNTIISKFKNVDDLELIERVKAIYNENIYDKITRAYRDNNFVPECKHYANDIKAIVKPLYIVNMYRNRLKALLNDTLNVYGNVNNISKSITTLTQTRLSRNLDLVYDKFYPKLLSLLMYISKEDFSSNEKLSNFLDISEKDTLGFFKAEKEKNTILEKEKIREERHQENIAEEFVEETEEDKKKKKVVAVGLKLVNKLIEEYKNNNKILDDDSLKSLNPDDKVYKMGLLLNILDNEYSDLFSSNKVKYNIIYADNIRIDYHGKFSDIVANITDMNMKLKEYSNIVLDIHKIEYDKDMRIEQRTSMLNDKRLQMRYLAKNIRVICDNIVAPLKTNLDDLLLSKEERERIISNPIDIIKPTNALVGAKKRTEGYTVLQALTEVYYFISGFNYLMKEGDLSGIGLLIDKKIGDES